MHYTSIENIHKVIDPLFLSDLKAELEEIKRIPVERTRETRLAAYQDKLASLTFLDPAAAPATSSPRAISPCGGWKTRSLKSGSFWTKAGTDTRSPVRWPGAKGP